MGSQLPDAITQTADSARLQNIPWDAGYKTQEAFAEIQAPLLKDARFARSLDLDLQARYTNFSASGTALDDATTWKVGLSYAPSDDIRFRAAYGTSFRAPTPFDLFRGGNVSTGTGTDPCNPGGLRAANATINANCIAAGAPTGPVPASTTVQLNAGGSPALQPEEGKSFTIGTVLTPTFLPRLNMTLDYYHITLTDAIGQTNLSQALQACYADPNFVTRSANPLDACFGYNLRNPDETLARINQYSININRLEAEGIDYSSNYSIPSLGPVPGSLSLDVKLQYIISNFNSGSNLTEARGTFGSPTWSGTFTPTYRVGQFTIAWMARFASGMEDPGIRTGTVPRNNPLGYSGTGTYVVNNLTVRWQGENSANPYVMLGINNVLDKDPPFTTGFIGTRMFNTQPVTYDVVGRYFFVNAGVRF
jgi:outer membrane receptor protein involved in Fe transport